jgi:hypothetical protein
VPNKIGMKNFLFVSVMLLSSMAFAQFPALEWVSQATGNRGVYILSTKAGPDGSIYSTGGFRGTIDFDPSPLVTNLVSEGENDIFVSKHDALGNLIWAIGFGDNFIDEGVSIDIDASSNIYITGVYQSQIDVDPSPEVFNLAGGSAFVLKLSNSGSFIWAKNLGIGSSLRFNSLDVDVQGNCVLAGKFRNSITFETSSGEVTHAANENSEDIILLKLDQSGEYIWSQFFGSTSTDAAKAMCTDADGNIYVTGNFENTIDIDFSSSEFLISSTTPGNDDAFILKLNSDGGFIWAKNIGGNSNDFGHVISVDNDGNVFSGGRYQNVAYMNPDDQNVTLTSNGSYDVYFLKLNSSGNYVWSGSIGSTNLYDDIFSMAIDDAGNVYFLGGFQNTIDLNPNAEEQMVTSNGGEDIYLIKIDNSGAFIWAKTIGGTDFEYAYAMSIGASQSILLAGAFQGTCDFDINDGVAELVSGGDSDLFLAKYVQNSVGINSLLDKNNLRIYPNPADNILSIELNNDIINPKLEIYSTSGVLMNSLIINNSHSTIDISELSNGVYYILIRSDSRVMSSHKIVKL